MRRALSAAAALALPLALWVPPGPATAADHAPSSVEVTHAQLHAEGAAIRGKVRSGTASCKKDRKVKVYHDVAPDGPSSGDFRLGTVETNQYGKWRLDTPYQPDRVYAKLRGTSACSKDRSPTVAVKSV